jgi:hypothetical protein
MVRSAKIWVAAALALAIATPEAQAFIRHHPRHGGDIYVHAGRSYLTAGPTGEVGTGNRYVTDTTPGSIANFGSPFAARMGSVLPSDFNPPGRPAPLLELWEP